MDVVKSGSAGPGCANIRSHVTEIRGLSAEELRRNAATRQTSFMAEQDWLAPASAPGSSPYENVVAATGIGRAPAYDLRPLSIGELLDRTFTLYRSRFWLFAGLASVSSGINFVSNVVQAVFQHFVRHKASTMTQVWSGLTTLVVVCIFFLAYSVTQAATVYAVSEVYLGRETTMGESLRATAGRWFSYMVVALWQWWSLVWIPVLLVLPAVIAIPMRITGLVVMGGILMFLGFTVGLAGGIILFLRNLLAIPAMVLEKLTIRPSMRRSKELAAGVKGRIFVVALVSWAMYLVFGALEMPLLFMVMTAVRQGGEAIGAQAVMLLINFVGYTVVSPVALIGLSLVYFDQRVRKEAFDIAVLLGETPAGFPAPAYAVAAESAAPVAENWSVAEPLTEPRVDDVRADDGSGV